MALAFPAFHIPPSGVRHRVVLVATLSSVLLYLDRICISIAGPFIQRDLGLTDQQLGWVFSSFFWAYALAQIPAGWLSDTRGARPMLTIYIVAWSVFTGLTGLVQGFILLLLVRLAFGAAQAGAYPTCGALLARWVPLADRGLASSMVALGGRVGGALAPFVTGQAIVAVAPALIVLGLIVHSSIGLHTWLAPWRVVMISYGLAGLLVAAVFWRVFRDRPEDHPRVNQAELELIGRGRVVEAAHAAAAVSSESGLVARRVVASASMWLMCLSQFGTNVGWVFLVTWLPKYLESVKGVVDADELGRLASIPLLVGMLGLPLGGRLTDRAVRLVGPRWGRSLPLASSRFVAAGAFIACLWLDSPWAVTAAFVMVAFSTDLGVAATWAFMQDVGGRHAGSILGWGNMWGNLGAAVSPLILEWAARELDHDHDWSEPFLVCAAAFIISGLASLGIDATRQMGARTEEAESV